jgi:hypothetical protein
MTVNTEELTMHELKSYIAHLERVLMYYNKSEIINMTTEHFKKVVANFTVKEV